MLAIHPRFPSLEGVNAYTDAGHEAKQFLHREGRRFLKALAKEVGIPAGTFDIRSNMGGIAVSGEVTLHSDTLYVQLSESLRPGIDIMFRTCKGRKDYSGGMNNFSHVRTLAAFPYERERFINELKRLGNFDELKRLGNFTV